MQETEEGRYLYTSKDILNDHIGSAETIQKFFDDNAKPNPSDADGIPESQNVEFDGTNNVRILRFYEPALEEVRTVVEEFGEVEWPAIGTESLQCNGFQFSSLMRGPCCLAYRQSVAHPVAHTPQKTHRPARGPRGGCGRSCAHMYPFRFFHQNTFALLQVSQSPYK